MAAMLIANTAAAQPQTDAKTRARAHYERGTAAYSDGRYKDAIDAFLDAHREYPSPALSFNAARAYDKLGDVPGALRFYREYLRQSPTVRDRGAVERRIQQLEQKLSTRGVQQVTILSNVEGATVIIDGRPVGVTPWTGEIAPGQHDLRLQREGFRDAKTTFALSDTRSRDVEVAMAAVELSEERPAPAPPPAAMPTVVEEEQGLERVGTPTWVTFGVGAAALIGAGTFEVLRAGREEAVRTAPTQLERQEAFEQGENYQTTARVLAIVGGAAVAAGGVLLYFDLSKNGSEPSRVGIGCAPTGCATTFGGTW